MNSATFYKRRAKYGGMDASLMARLRELAHENTRLKHNEANQTIAHHLITLTAENRDWGFGLCFAWMRNVVHLPVNHQQVYRIYCALALNLRSKPKRQLQRLKPQTLQESIRANQVWSMDFMHDQLSDGRS